MKTIGNICRMAAVAVVSLFAFSAKADAVARIGETEYESLGAAVAAATAGQTIDVIADISLTRACVITNSLTLNFGENTVTVSDCVVSSAECAAISIDAPDSTVVINGGRFVNANVNETEYIVGIRYGSASIVGGTFSSCAECGVIGFWDPAQLTVSGISVYQSGCSPCLSGDGKLTILNSTLHQTGISASAGSARKCTAVYTYLDGDVTIGEDANDTSDIRGAAYGFVESNTGGSLTMNGGTVATFGKTKNTRPFGYTGITVYNDCAILLESKSLDAGILRASSAVINGGTVIGALCVGKGSTDCANEFTINGGTFNDYAAFLATGTGTDLCRLVINGENATFVDALPVARIGANEYISLDAAVAAATAGQTIDVIRDCRVSAPVTINKALTINFDDYTVDLGGFLASEAAIVAAADGAKVTMNGGQFVNIGTGVRSVYVESGSLDIIGGYFTNRNNRCAITCAANGQLKLDEVVVIQDSDSSCVYAEGGHVLVLNSSLHQTGTAEYNQYWCSAISASTSGEVVIGEDEDDTSDIRGAAYAYASLTSGASLTVNGGTLASYGLTKYWRSLSGGNVKVDKDCAILVDHTDSSGLKPATVIINGGSIENGFCLGAGKATSPVSVTINGGTFLNFCAFFGTVNPSAYCNLVINGDTATFRNDGVDPNQYVADYDKICKWNPWANYFQIWTNAYHFSVSGTGNAQLTGFTDCYGGNHTAAELTYSPHLNKYPPNTSMSVTFTSNNGYAFDNGLFTKTVQGNFVDGNLVFEIPATVPYAAVARIGSTDYYSLNAAVAAASAGATIDVLRDFDLQEYCTISKALTINAGNYVINTSTSTPATKSPIVVDSTNMVTISGGVITNTTTSTALISVSTGGQLTLSGATVIQDGGYSAVRSLGSTFIYNSVIHQNGVLESDKYNCAALMAGYAGHITVGADADDTSDIRGAAYGYFSSSTGGALTMNGGTLATYGKTKYYSSFGYGDTLVIVSNNCAVCQDHTNMKKNGATVIINGGTVEGGFCLAGGYSGYPVLTTINGGTFKGFCVFFEKKNLPSDLSKLVVNGDTAAFQGNDPRMFVSDYNKMCKWNPSTGYYQTWTNAYHFSVSGSGNATFTKFTDCYGAEFAPSALTAKPYLNKFAEGDSVTCTFTANTGYVFANDKPVTTVVGNFTDHDIEILMPTATMGIPEPVIGGDGGASITMADGQFNIRVTNASDTYKYGYKKSTTLAGFNDLTDEDIVWFTVEVQKGADEVTLPIPVDDNESTCFYKLVVRIKE